MIDAILRLANIFHKVAVPIDTAYVRSLHSEDLREATGKKKVIVYHGTSSKKLALIVQHGSMDPAQAKDYVNWDSVSPGIYVTRNLEGFTGAWMYAHHAAKQGGDPVVLELTIPLNWIDIDPDDTHHNEAGDINDLGEDQGVVRKPISIKNIKGVQFQGSEIGKIKPQNRDALFERDKTKWMPIGVALRLIAKHVQSLPEEYQQMVSPLPKGMSRQLSYEDIENKYASAMESFYSSYIGSPGDRFNGRSTNEVALIWLLKNKNALYQNAQNALEEFGKIIGVDMHEQLEYLGEDYKPKPYETLRRFLDRV